MLPGLTRINIQRRSSPPVIAHVKSNSTFHHASDLDSVPSVSAIEDQILARLETANSAAKAHPWRKRQVGQEIYPCSRSNKDRTVIIGNHILSVINVFIRIENRRHFNRQVPPTIAPNPPREVYFERGPLAKMHGVVEKIRARRSLIADDCASDSPGQLILGLLGKGHNTPDDEDHPHRRQNFSHLSSNA